MSRLYLTPMAPVPATTPRGNRASDCAYKFLPESFRPAIALQPVVIGTLATGCAQRLKLLGEPQAGKPATQRMDSGLLQCRFAAVGVAGAVGQSRLFRLGAVPVFLADIAPAFPGNSWRMR